MKEFFIGCNYWASNAGMMTWRYFDERIVKKDLSLLKEYGMNTIRIFPLWQDFQPVEATTSPTHKLRKDGQPLTTPAGLDETQLENFGKVLDIAEKNGLRVIVGLITGWMSGRMFVPQFIGDAGPITSPKAIVWECRFIREFVARFKDRKCIIAWEPGNEVNCMEGVKNADEAELWLSAITDAIRVADDSRPIYSGMHSLTCTSFWSIPMVGHYVDMQTTHPYPLFTENCDIESVLEMRSALHPAAESAYYAGISGKPCLVEEVNVLGPMVLSDSYTPEFIEKSLFSSLQYGASGYLWWCGFDQDQFNFAPYDVSALEQNLGLFYSDSTPKPVVKRMKEISAILEELGEISSVKKDGVAIICRDRANPYGEWSTAYGAFCLAAQAGYTVDFCFEEQPLKDSEYYILPSIRSLDGIPKKLLGELKEKIKGGAKLLIIYDGGNIGEFEALTGLKVAGREHHVKNKSFLLNGKRVDISVDINVYLNADSAKVLVKDDNGDIILSENDYGKGKVYFLSVPLESFYTKSYKPHDGDLCEVYALFFADAQKPIRFESKYLCVTYHGEKVLITNFGKENEIPFALQEGYEITDTNYCGVKGSVLKLNSSFAWLTVSKK